MVVVPFGDTIEGLKGDLFETFVEPYFKETYRPVRVGDTFLAHGAMRTVEFKVVSVETEAEGEDARYCIVGDETEVEIAEEPLRVRCRLGLVFWGDGWAIRKEVHSLGLTGLTRSIPIPTPKPHSARTTSGWTRSDTTTSAGARSSWP